MSDILRKIKSLERLAANPGTPQEGDLARQKALELRKKYNLEEEVTEIFRFSIIDSNLPQLAKLIVVLNQFGFAFQGTKNRIFMFWNVVNNSKLSVEPDGQWIHHRGTDIISSGWDISTLFLYVNGKSRTI